MTKNSDYTVPKQILQRRFLLRSVIFVSLFSMLFMSLYQPSFGFSTTWFGFHSWKQTGVTLLFYVVAISTLVLSKFLLSNYSNGHNVSARRLLVWHIVEFFAIAGEYYAFSAYFKLGSVIVTQLHRLIQFRDSQGKHKMSLSEDSIFYIESQDNYVQIFYDLEGKLSSYLLRCSTQKIEEDLEGTQIVRCRRSFLVNTAKVIRYGKERGHLTITLDHPSGKTITVTPAYYRTILTRLDSRSV